MITKKDYETAKKNYTKLLKARNKSNALIEDTIARYIKAQTRAKSKKLALEKDALVNAEKYDCIKMYDGISDIQEAYGVGAISESEMDRLESLWAEREAIKKNVDDSGYYSDEVTQALDKALLSIADIYDDDIHNAKELIKKFENGDY